MKKAKETDATASKTEITDHPISLAAMFSKKAVFQRAIFWIVGDTPLITHAWSAKAKSEMLQKQLGAVRSAREKRDPQADYLASLYEMGEPGVYGFPVTGVKNAILAAAHKDKGLARSAVQSALFLEAEMSRLRPALAGAICDMPLVRIHGSAPEMREDMVKIGSGLNKVASLAYRPQFTFWALRIEAQFNPKIVTPEALGFLVEEAGRACGLGEWRTERKGVFGSFHLATAVEEKAWTDFAAAGGKGHPPIAASYLPVPSQQLAAE